MRPRFVIEAAVSLLRSSFRSDDAESESAHLVCAELESSLIEVDAARVVAPAAWKLILTSGVDLSPTTLAAIADARSDLREALRAYQAIRDEAAKSR